LISDFQSPLVTNQGLTPILLPPFCNYSKPFLPYRIPKAPYIVPHFFLTYRAGSTIFLLRKSNVLSFDATLNCVIELHGNQLKDHWLFEEQFARWKREQLSNAQAKEVDRLTHQSSKLKGTNEEILEIVHPLGESTIDKIMPMDEVELALGVLSGRLRPPT